MAAIPLRTPGCAVTVSAPTDGAALSAPSSRCTALPGAAEAGACGGGPGGQRHGGGGAGGGARRAGRGVPRPGPLNSDRTGEDFSFLGPASKPVRPSRGPSPGSRRGAAPSRQAAEAPRPPALPERSLPIEAPPRASLSGGAPLGACARPSASPYGSGSRRGRGRGCAPAPLGRLGRRLGERTCSRPGTAGLSAFTPK